MFCQIKVLYIPVNLSTVLPCQHFMNFDQYMLIWPLNTYPPMIFLLLVYHTSKMNIMVGVQFMDAINPFSRFHLLRLIGQVNKLTIIVLVHNDDNIKIQMGLYAKNSINNMAWVYFSWVLVEAGIWIKFEGFLPLVTVKLVLIIDKIVIFSFPWSRTRQVLKIVLIGILLRPWLRIRLVSSY